MLGIEPSLEPLDRKIYNLHFDNLLNTGQLNPEILPLMDCWQQHAVNEVKKALARIKNKK